MPPPVLLYTRGMSEELLRKAGCVALGGALGSLLRFAVAQWAIRQLPQGYPWGTTFANLLGALLFGFLWALAEQREGFSSAWRLFLMTGFLGAFTTFSTFMFETVRLLDGARPSLGLLNIGLQNALGLACIYLGLLGGRTLNLLR